MIERDSLKNSDSLTWLNTEDLGPIEISRILATPEGTSLRQLMSFQVSLRQHFIVLTYICTLVNPRAQQILGISSKYKTKVRGPTIRILLSRKTP